MTGLGSHSLMRCRSNHRLASSATASSDSLPAMSSVGARTPSEPALRPPCGQQTIARNAGSSRAAKSAAAEAGPAAKRPSGRSCVSGRPPGHRCAAMIRLASKAGSLRSHPVCASTAASLGARRLMMSDANATDSRTRATNRLDGLQDVLPLTSANRTMPSGRVGHNNVPGNRALPVATIRDSIVPLEMSGAIGDSMEQQACHSRSSFLRGGFGNEHSLRGVQCCSGVSGSHCISSAWHVRCLQFTLPGGRVDRLARGLEPGFRKEDGGSGPEPRAGRQPDSRTSQSVHRRDAGDQPRWVHHGGRSRAERV